MTTEATVTHPAEDWSDGPIGNDDGYTDGNDFEESMEFPANTLAGINERAEVREPYNKANREAYRLDLLHESVAVMFPQWPSYYAEV